MRRTSPLSLSLTTKEHDTSVDTVEASQPVVVGKVITVHGYEELKRVIWKLHDGNIQIYVLFAGDVDAKGVNWCSHCTLADPVIMSNLRRLNADDYLITCHVGDRENWLNPNNEFRKDPMFQVSMIPTLIKFGSHRRLVGSQCLQEHLIELMFEDAEGCEPSPSPVLRKLPPRKNCCCCRVTCLS